MKKQLILNLDLRRRLDKEQELYKKYAEYIKTIYIDIPYKSSSNKSFICNTNYLSQLNWPKDYIKIKLLEQIDFIRSNNLNISIPINNENLQESDLVEALNFINLVKPDELVIKKEYELFFNQNSNYKLIMSRFNEDSTILSSKYPVTVRSTHIKRFGKWVQNIENRILLNYCCPVCCPGCNYEYKHDTYFSSEWDNDVTKYLANTVWLGNDIKLAEKIWPDINFTYKIASRLWIEDKFKGIKFLNDYLDTIINCNLNNIINTPYISIYFINTPFQDLYFKENKLNSFDLNYFKQLKLQYWKSIDDTITNY